MTVNELREFLAQKEAQWSPEDDQYLGKFGDQAINLPFYGYRAGVDTLQFLGYTPDVLIWYDITGLGFLMDTRDDG
jgi:hypothetical protein